MSNMEDFELEIDKVLEGVVDCVKLPLAPLSVYIDTISTKLDGLDGEWETNGYECDFWMTFDTGYDTYVLSGDLWYCKHVTFKKQQ